MSTPKAPVTPMENIREPQPLKDSIAFVYDTDVHQLASFILSGFSIGSHEVDACIGAFLPGAGHPDLGTASAGRLHSTQGERRSASTELIYLSLGGVARQSSGFPSLNKHALPLTFFIT